MNQTKPHENIKAIKIQVMWIQKLTYYRALQVKQNVRVKGYREERKGDSARVSPCLPKETHDSLNLGKRMMC